jgi:hypothetical protein
MKKVLIIIAVTLLSTSAFARKGCDSEQLQQAQAECVSDGDGNAINCTSNNKGTRHRFQCSGDSTGAIRQYPAKTNKIVKKKRN